MKKLIVLLAGMMMIGSFAFSATDNAKKDEEHSVDHSKNPITGTETTTEKYQHEGQTAQGGKYDVNVKEKTKIKKDGTVKQTVDVEAETTTKQ